MDAHGGYVALRRLRKSAALTSSSRQMGFSSLEPGSPGACEYMASNAASPGRP
jgi:hypothetical protein